jgi:hypothetical protein
VLDLLAPPYDPNLGCSYFEDDGPARNRRPVATQPADLVTRWAIPGSARDGETGDDAASTGPTGLGDKQAKQGAMQPGEERILRVSGKKSTSCHQA